MKKEIIVGRKGPDFELLSQEGKIIRLSDYEEKLRVILLSFKYAFNSPCDKEIRAFNSYVEEFAKLDTQLIGISNDSYYTLKAWSDSLGGIKYPLVSDFHPHGFTSRKYGLWIEEKGIWKRAALIIDRKRILRWKKVYEGDEYPKPEEILKILKELKIY